MTVAHNSGILPQDRAASAETARKPARLPELCARTWSAVARAGRGVRWYVGNLMGDNAYAVYVAHLRRTHPDREPLTERQFWRQRMDDQDRNPGARCC